jgi:predicted dehydrogenase
MDAASTVRLAVIGAGRWGTRYISTIVENSGTLLQCVVSRNELTRTLVPDSCDVVPSWQEALARDNLDGIVIATPPHTHFDIATVALARELPVIVEKPMTLDVAQAYALRRQAEAAGVPFLVGHVHLFSPVFARMKRELTTLGPIRRIRSVGANQGPIRIDIPAMWDYGPHDLAMTLDLLADRPSAVAARLADRLVTTEGFGEAINIELEFGMTTRAEINVSNIAKRRIRLFEVQTDTCSVVYDDTQDQKLKRRNLGSTVDFVLDYEEERPLTRLVREFASAIRERRPTPEALTLGCAVIDILAQCQTILTGTARP